MIEIFNEDCMAGMTRFPDKHFDLAIVDPPYGYASKNKKNAKLNFRMEQKDWNIAPKPEYFIELKRVSKDQIVWGGNYFAKELGAFRCFIYWHKGNPVDNFSDGELAWTSFDRNAKQFDFRYYGTHEGHTLAQKKFHPTQKPVALYSWLLNNYAKPGMRILDTHLGSGSSAIASHFFGADFTGFEIDAEYFEAAKARIERETAQIPMFL